MKLKKDDDVYIKTAKGGRIAMRNLRPGDWLDARELFVSAPWFLVLQNSAVMQRVELRYRDGHTAVSTYDSCAGYGDTYIGRGQKRKWWDMLPRWIQRHVMPYSKPKS